jgi:hypothetical protein
VVAPGRVTITRSSKPLAVYCKRDGVGSADEWWGAHYNANRLVGNILFSAGLRDVRREQLCYAATLTVTCARRSPARRLWSGRSGIADLLTPIHF